MGQFSVEKPVAPGSALSGNQQLEILKTKTGRADAEQQRIPALIARYKQAILSAAFSGKLTEAWRAKSR